MRVVNRRFQAGLALATAGCLLTTPCAADWRVDGESLVYAPAPGSTLVSRPDLPFKLARIERGASRTTVLAYQAAGSKPLPVAAISSSCSDPDARVSVHLRWPADEPSDP